MSTATTVPKRARPLDMSFVTRRPSVLAVAAMVGYLPSVVAANVASVLWPPMLVAGLLVPAGTLFAGAALTARDLLHDTLGVHGVAAGIVVGAGLSAALASPQLAVAGVVAFTASEVLDALVYVRLRRHSRLGAVAASNAVGLVVDSVLFVPLAFGSSAAVPGQILGKTVATVLTLAVLRGTGLMRWAVRS
ncbi:VUT family protein [Saccharothrix sp. NRRL B-16314]|uniref:VUT family protein n=1 Tax=Saccharothrix sp. NRRL B-16314 TaxID=1463825 RepID=UPI001E3C54BB|nr:VUT family protein [Saccharothrix sp. NRRL B-16314]